MSVLSCPLSSPDWCTFCIRSALPAGQISWQNSSDREIPPDHAMKSRQDKAHRYSDAVRGNSHSCLPSISWRSISDPIRKYPARATAPSVVDEGGKPISRCHPAVTVTGAIIGSSPADRSQRVETDARSQYPRSHLSVLCYRVSLC